MNETQWILAFDASCGRCRQISEVVARVAGGKLRVLPMAHPEVIRWRARAFGENPAWVPALLRVDPSGAVRGWAGPAMALPMARLLGVGSVIELLRGLGSLPRARAADGAATAPRHGGGFGLMPVGIVAVLAGWLMINAQTGPGNGGDAHRWVQENLNQLPQDYDGITAHPVNYRKAMYPHLSAEVRSALWSEQIRRYTAGHPDLTPAQTRVLDTATAFAADAANFAPGAPIDDDRQQEFKRQADTAFGRNQAARLFAVLGADVASSEAAPAGRRGCTCATSDDWCDNSTHCDDSNQCDDTSGCGWWWGAECNGLCVN